MASTRGLAVGLSWAGRLRDGGGSQPRNGLPAGLVTAGACRPSASFTPAIERSSFRVSEGRRPGMHRRFSGLGPSLAPQ